MTIKLLLKIDEVGGALGISRSQVFVLIAKGDLESVTIGRSRRVPTESVQAFVAARRGR